MSKSKALSQINKSFRDPLIPEDRKKFVHGTSAEAMQIADKVDKSLAIIADVAPEKAASHHQDAHLHLAIGAAYAVLCGVELQRIQEELPKSGTRATFGDWLKTHRSILGFERTMAFRYKKVADHVKSRMLVNGDLDVLVLLGRNPASLNDHESKLILKAVNKAVDGQSLRELMVEMKIARGDHGEALENAVTTKTKKKSSAAPNKADLLIQDELFGRFDGVDKIVKAWNKTLKVGNTKVPTWEHMTQAQKTKAEHWLDTTITKLTDMRNQVKEALKSK